VRFTAASKLFQCAKQKPTRHHTFQRGGVWEKDTPCEGAGGKKKAAYESAKPDMATPAVEGICFFVFWVLGVRGGPNKVGVTKAEEGKKAEWKSSAGQRDTAKRKKGKGEGEVREKRGRADRTRKKGGGITLPIFCLGEQWQGGKRRRYTKMCDRLAGLGRA